MSLFVGGFLVFNRSPHRGSGWGNMSLVWLYLARLISGTRFSRACLLCRGRKVLHIPNPRASINVETSITACKGQNRTECSAAESHNFVSSLCLKSPLFAFSASWTLLDLPLKWKIGCYPFDTSGSNTKGHGGDHLIERKWTC